MGKVFKGFCYGLAFCTVAECMGSYDASRAKKRINKNLTEIIQKAPQKSQNIIKNDTFLYWKDEEDYLQKNLKTINDSIKKVQDSIRIDSIAKKAYFEGLQKVKK